MTKTFCDKCGQETELAAMRPLQSRVFLSTPRTGAQITFGASIITSASFEHLCDACWTEALHLAFPLVARKDGEVQNPTNTQQENP